MTMIPKKKTCSKCYTSQYVHKRVEGKAICKSCYFKSDNFKKRKKIKKKSKKQEAIDIEYTSLRKEHLTMKPMCEVSFPGCMAKASEIHHIEYRGVNTNNTESWVSICRNCHIFVHNNPLIAKENGFL